MESIFKDEKQQRIFEEKGYITMPLLSSKEIEFLLNEVQTMKPNDNYQGRNQYGLHFSCLDGNVQYRWKVYHLINKIVTPYINNIVKDSRIIFTNFVVKSPGKGHLYHHQHPPLNFYISEYTVLNLWCPLVDTNELNGAIQVLESSHKTFSNFISLSSVFSFDKPEFVKMIERHSKIIPLKAGECIIFDQRLIHGSGINYTNQARFAMQTYIIQNNDKPVFYYADSSKNNSWVEVFETDNDFYCEDDVCPTERPSHLKSLGLMKHKNLNEKEVMRKLLSDGSKKERSFLSKIWKF
jgi:hypothetical protein